MDSERFEITRSLGKDLLGGLYEAWDAQDNRKIAMRRFFVPTEKPIVDHYKAEFIRIAHNLQQLIHPNLIQIFDSGYDHDGPYLASEVLEHRLLSDIHKEGALPPLQVRTIGKQLFEALDFCHSKNFIHGTLTLKSIKVKETEEGNKTYIITDLGLKHLSEFLHDCYQNDLADPCFTAPELFNGGVASIRSDTYTLGNMLYALLLGGHPFAGWSKEEAAKLHLEGLPPAHEYNSLLPKPLVKWIELLTAPNAQSRPHSAAAALSALPDADQLEDTTPNL